MSTHTPSGFNWADAVQPLEARRQARVVGSYVANTHGDRRPALEAIASLVRRRPAAVDASVLRRAAGQARSAGGRR
jgi:hypothetical protein